MDNVARMPPGVRRELFNETAAKMPYLSAAAIEKDFWVCWILKQLFDSPLKNILIFKGGTSLSKIFKLINRFSEDIDLILNWQGNPIGDPLVNRSNTEQARFNKELDAWGQEYIGKTLFPRIQTLCGDICRADFQPDQPDCIVVTYPKAFEDAYLRPQILLEIGAKAARVPHASYFITPYAAEAYSQAFRSPSTAIVATTPERSFWEKVTILHAEAHRPLGGKSRERYSRHYYDTAMMVQSHIKSNALADFRLLAQVVAFKDKFYHCGWANYQDAKPGTMKLLPPQHLFDDLRDDYRKMRSMIYGDYPSFTEIMAILAQLEQEINAVKIPPPF